MNNNQYRLTAFSIIFLFSAFGWLIMEQVISHNSRVATNVVIENRTEKYGSGLLDAPKTGRAGGGNKQQTPSTTGEPSKPSLTPAQRQQWNSLPQATKEWVKSLSVEQREALKKQYGIK